MSSSAERNFQTEYFRHHFLEVLRRAHPEALFELWAGVLPPFRDFWKCSGRRGGAQPPDLDWETVGRASAHYRTDLVKLQQSLMNWGRSYHLSSESWALDTALYTVAGWLEEEQLRGGRDSCGALRKLLYWQYRQIPLSALKVGSEDGRFSKYTDTRHFLWLVLFHVDELRASEIAREVGADRTTVADAVRITAKLIGLSSLRAAPRGRPRKTESAARSSRRSH